MMIPTTGDASLFGAEDPMGQFSITHAPAGNPKPSTSDFLNGSRRFLYQAFG
jgi:hypothetical protein